MTNFEHYKDDILAVAEAGNDIAFDACDKKIVSCYDLPCIDCLFYNAQVGCRSTGLKWLCAEYKEPEPEIDWTTVPVDTKIYVRDENNQTWEPRYFSHYNAKTRLIYAFLGGTTSWSNQNDPTCCSHWKQAKLAEECDNK